MAGKNATQLYLSQAWKNTRRDYIRSVGGLCEICLSRGIINPAEIVHHRVPLNEENVKDLNISLGWNNLQALCRKCHADVHDEMYRKRSKKRYKIDKNGHIIIDEIPPLQKNF